MSDALIAWYDTNPVVQGIVAAAYERGVAAGRKRAAADIRAVALQRSTAARVIAGAQDPGVEDMEWAARVAEGTDRG